MRTMNPSKPSLLAGWLIFFAIGAAGFFDHAVQTFGGSYNGRRDFPIGHDCIGWINLYLTDTRRAEAGVSALSAVDPDELAPPGSPAFEQLRSGVDW